MSLLPAGILAKTCFEESSWSRLSRCYSTSIKVHVKPSSKNGKSLLLYHVYENLQWLILSTEFFSLRNLAYNSDVFWNNNTASKCKKYISVTSELNLFFSFLSGIIFPKVSVKIYENSLHPFFLTSCLGKNNFLFWNWQSDGMEQNLTKMFLR